ncbi:MAG: hypothetical protein HYV99_09955 [Betaproteobacteria bacterium]|nr:hypothetical protein [Betaproteobacteria bacterium]
MATPDIFGIPVTLAVMGVQFLLTARFRCVTAPSGLDIIYPENSWG